LKLTALSKPARKAFYEGKLNASTALLIARIPVESLQADALKTIIHEQWDGLPMSFRRASEIVHSSYMTRLSDAGFPTQAPDLVPAAGPCGSCPKRTGNQPELFGDVKGADVCTDPVCFKAKRTAYAALVIAQAKETGQTVITGKEAKKLKPYNHGGLQAGYAQLSDRCYEDGKNRTYGQLLGKDFQPVLVQDPDTGVLIKAAPPAAIKEALKAAGVKDRPSSSNPQSAAEKKAKAERKFRQALFAKVRESYPPSLARADWNDLVLAFLQEMQQETCKQVFALWGWEPVKEKYGTSYRKAAAEYVSKLSGADMSKLLFDCILVSDLQVSTWSDAKPQKLFDAAKRFKVNAEAVRRQLNADQIPKAKKKAAARKPK